MLVFGLGDSVWVWFVWLVSSAVLIWADVLGDCAGVVVLLGCTGFVCCLLRLVRNLDWLFVSGLVGLWFGGCLC